MQPDSPPLSTRTTSVKEPSCGTVIGQPNKFGPRKSPLGGRDEQGPRRTLEVRL